MLSFSLYLYTLYDVIVRFNFLKIRNARYFYGRFHFYTFKFLILDDDERHIFYFCFYHLLYFYLNFHATHVKISVAEFVFSL